MADNGVFFLSETVVGLQAQLNCLRRAATSLQLTVNMNKSNIIVFRKGGYLSARERWAYNGVAMPVVNVYKYLGIIFTTSLSFVSGCRDLTSRGKRALVYAMKRLSHLGNTSFKLFIKIFDAQVQPIMQYGSELWGMNKAAQDCESLHLFALKKFLGLSMRTPNDLVYGETNRYPVYINSAVQCLRYWFKLLEMEARRIPKKAYNMLFELDSKGKINWVTDMRTCLYKYGFGDVWLCQGVGNKNVFIRIFRQRLIDCRWQMWTDHVENSDRFSIYRSFCISHEVKSYLTLNMDRHLLNTLVRFRLGVSALFTHYYRYRNVGDNDLLCPLCKESEEDEMHFVLCCPALREIRDKFIASKYFQKPCMFKFIMLMSSEKRTDVQSLSRFLHKAFKFREIAMS